MSFIIPMTLRVQFDIASTRSQQNAGKVSSGQKPGPSGPVQQTPQQLTQQPSPDGKNGKTTSIPLPDNPNSKIIVG